jgi:hypothetical protein
MTARPWSPQQAHAWHRRMPWLVGANYVPRTAINQLEMWQAESFDLKTVDQELGWAASLGFNSMRVFLHHLLWEQDAAGFLRRVEQFLDVAERHGIGAMFVLFDSVWDPHPRQGPQRAPHPHRHNSGWVQSPGAEVLADPARHDALREYVTGVIRHFRDDARVHVWDVWNEPDNPVVQYRDVELPDKAAAVLPVLRNAFVWSREAQPSQPITSGLWCNWRGKKIDELSAIQRLQVEASDVISFHTYAPVEEVRRDLEALRVHGRPILCTEYMARPLGSTFDPVMGLFKKEGVAAYNWGFVSGKSQTIYPWDSWEKVYDGEPRPWFHDVLREDGSPYNEAEADYIRSVTKPRS